MISVLENSGVKVIVDVVVEVVRSELALTLGEIFEANDVAFLYRTAGNNVELLGVGWCATDSDSDKKFEVFLGRESTVSAELSFQIKVATRNG